MHTHFRTGFAAFAVAVAATAVFAQPPAGQQPGPGAAGGGGRGGRGGAPQVVGAVTPVPGKANLYIVPGAGPNTVVRVTDDGILLVDTKNIGEANYTALVAQIRTISDTPVRTVVITDVHQEHSGLTAQFVAAGAQVVAHEMEKKNLETYTNALGTPAPPNVTYTTDYPVRFGAGEIARVHHFGPAATAGDSIVHFPDLKVVVTGDVYQNGMNVDYAMGGSLIGWQTVLEKILALDFDTVIPNRGALATRADLQAAHARVSTIVSTAIDLVKKGTPKDQLVARIDATDETLNAGGFLQNNPARLDAFYEEIAAAAK